MWEEAKDLLTLHYEACTNHSAAATNNTADNDGVVISDTTVISQDDVETGAATDDVGGSNMEGADSSAPLDDKAGLSQNVGDNDASTVEIEEVSSSDAAVGLTNAAIDEIEEFSNTVAAVTDVKTGNHGDDDVDVATSKDPNPKSTSVGTHNGSAISIDATAGPALTIHQVLLSMFNLSK